MKLFNEERTSSERSQHKKNPSIHSPGKLNPARRRKGGNDDEEEDDTLMRQSTSMHQYPSVLVTNKSQCSESRQARGVDLYSFRKLDVLLIVLE